MRDIAEQLAFLAIREAGQFGWRPGGRQAFDGSGPLRKALADAFEYLLNNLPEGTIHAEQ